MANPRLAWGRQHIRSLVHHKSRKSVLTTASGKRLRRHIGDTERRAGRFRARRYRGGRTAQATAATRQTFQHVGTTRVAHGSPQVMA